MPVWIGLIGGFFGILTVVAAAIAVVRANLATVTIATYKADNDALRGRVATLEDEVKAKTSELADCTGRVAALEKERDYLTRIVTGRAAIEKLEETIVAQHADMLEGLDKVVEAMAVIAATGALKNPRSGQ